MKCHACQAEVSRDSRFCANCGAKLEAQSAVQCPACQTNVRPESKFCPNCGETLAGESPEVSPADDDLQVEQVQSQNRALSLALLIGVPILVGILFLLFYPRSNPAPVNANATSTPQASNNQSDPFDMSAMQPIFDKLDSLKAVIATNPKDTTALAELAMLYEMAGKFEEASGYYQSLITASPHNFQARMNLASVYFNMGKHQDALNELSIVLDHVPNYGFAMYNMGVIYAAMNENQKAKEWWQRVLENEPNSDIGKRAAEGINMLQ